MKVELWLYGPLAAYAGEASKGSHACLHLELPGGATVGDLIARLEIPPAEKGITFVNAQLTDMPDLGADVDLELRDGDRVGIFHRRSMWPFQYRFGASLSSKLRNVMQQQQDGAIHHSTAVREDG